MRERLTAAGVLPFLSSALRVWVCVPGPEARRAARAAEPCGAGQRLGAWAAGVWERVSPAPDARAPDAREPLQHAEAAERDDWAPCGPARGGSAAHGWAQRAAQVATAEGETARHARAPGGWRAR